MEDKGVDANDEEEEEEEDEDDDEEEEEEDVDVETKDTGVEDSPAAEANKFKLSKVSKWQAKPTSMSIASPNVFPVRARSAPLSVRKTP